MAPARNPLDLFASGAPAATLDARERLACLRLIRSENIGPVTFRELIAHFGGAQSAIDALPELSRRGGRGRPIRICSASDAEAEFVAAAALSAAPLFMTEPDYPPLLAAIDAPPPMIYVKGRVNIFSAPAVAIVGSRLCSAAGAKLASKFAAAISQAGYVVVSGLARGIDRIAHEASIVGGTVAVLAGGVDKIYPPEHAALYAEVAQRGCLVSERPPGLTAQPKDFPRRNRIIAGLAHGVVIVEAAARSGTLVTARYAGEYGREVFAVPGHPLDPRAEGTNNLLKSGATLVTTPDDVLEMLKPIAGGGPQSRWPSLSEARAPAPSPRLSEPPPIGPNERDAVLAALSAAPADLDAIAQATQLPIRYVQIALLELELAGRIVRPGPGLVALRSAD